MTILHKDKQPLSLKGTWSESHCCVDCGYNTFPGAPPRELAEYLLDRDGNVPLHVTNECEIFFVKDSIWKKSGLAPYGGCLCVGCLERRIGRKLRAKDFSFDHPFNQPHVPCTERLRERRGGGIA